MLRTTPSVYTRDFPTFCSCTDKLWFSLTYKEVSFYSGKVKIVFCSIITFFSSIYEYILPDPLASIIGRYNINFVHSGLQDESLQVTISKLP